MVMRRFVPFTITEKRIKSTEGYKDFCESIIARLNIKQLDGWADLTTIKEVAKIFNEMRHHGMTAGWGSVAQYHTAWSASGTTMTSYPIVISRPSKA